MNDAVSDAQPQSSLAYGWLTVGLLTIAYIFSFIDRYVLGLLIEPIKADLGLTDTQIGLLLGPAFAIFYATMGLPLGWLCLLYTSPSPRDRQKYRMPSSA